MNLVFKGLDSITLVCLYSVNRQQKELFIRLFVVNIFYLLLDNKFQTLL